MRLITGNLLRGHLDTMVLSMLSKGETHGFEIIRRLEESGNGSLKLKEGTLYPILYRLEKEGLVEACWEDGTTRHQGPRRRVYRIVNKGKRELKGRRKQWREFVKVIGDIVEVPSCKHLKST